MPRTIEFNSLGDFARHLIGVEVAVKAAEHKGLKKAAVLIENAAKAEIGHYQGAAGPFPAWAPLADPTEASKARKGYPAGAPLLASGDMRDNISHQVSGHEAVIGSPDDKAFYHEFGTSKMPPRPIFGPAVFSNKAKIQRIIGAAVVSGIIGGEIVAGGHEYFFGE